MAKYTQNHFQHNMQKAHKYMNQNELKLPVKSTCKPGYKTKHKRKNELYQNVYIFTDSSGTTPDGQTTQQ